MVKLILIKYFLTAIYEINYKRSVNHHLPTALYNVHTGDDRWLPVLLRVAVNVVRRT